MTDILSSNSLIDALEAFEAAETNLAKLVA